MDYPIHPLVSSLWVLFSILRIQDWNSCPEASSVSASLVHQLLENFKRVSDQLISFRIKSILWLLQYSKNERELDMTRKKIFLDTWIIQGPNSYDIDNFSIWSYLLSFFTKFLQQRLHAFIAQRVNEFFRPEGYQLLSNTVTNSMDHFKGSTSELLIIAPTQ